MTRAEFIATAFSYPNDINIWYSTTSPYYIKGLTIPIINAQGENILEYLQQSTELNIEIQPNIFIILRVTGGELYTSTGDTTFYYLDVNPYYDITSIVNSPGFVTAIPQTRLIFTNIVNEFEFNASGYNVVLNNVQDNRTSNYITMQGTNTLADVQDSSYSITGWINGRYDGSKTSTDTYLGISPTITGKAFQGSYYPKTVTDTQIKSQVSAGEVVYTEYLYTGKEQLPTYIVIDDAYAIPDDLYGPLSPIPPTATTIPIILKSDAPKSTPIPAVGDIIQVGTSTELIKIQQVGSYDDNAGYVNPLYRLTVIRGYNKTTAQTITPTSPTLLPVKLATPSLIFKLEGSKVQGVDIGKVYAQTSGEILHVDELGYIVSGSFLPA